MAHKPGRLLPGPWWRRGPLIDEDANCVAHVVWRDGALVDLKGNSWTQNGTVPQTVPNGRRPPGAGPFSGVNYYSLGAGADVLDFAGGTFTVVVVGTGAPSPQFAFTNAAIGSTGYTIGATTGQVGLFALWPSFAQVATVNAMSVGNPFVMCGGRDGGASTIYGKLNLGAVLTASSAYTAPTGSAALLGGGAGNAWTGALWEFYATTTAPSDALFTSITRAVASRLRVSL